MKILEDVNMSKVDVVEILKKSDALLEGHFLLSSGKHSNRYVQCAKVLRYPEYAAQVLSTVVDQIKDLDIDLVVGPAMGGVIVSYELGRQLNKEAVFTERKDGVMQLRRGFEVKPGAKFFLSFSINSVLSVTNLPLVLFEYTNPSLSNSANAFCIVFGFTIASAAKLLTESNFESNSISPEIILTFNCSTSCIYTGLLLSIFHSILTPPYYCINTLIQ